MSFRDPRFAIAMVIIILFAWAYYHSPTQEMAGALIAAFSGAWGYFLGSSSGAAKNADNTGKALDLAATVAPPAPAPAAVTLDPGQSATVAAAPTEGA